MPSTLSFRFRFATFLALIYSLAPPAAHAQQVVATWTNSSGNWSSAANWSTNPAVPNNGGGTTYSVTIGTSNSAVTMDLLNLTIDTLTLGATDRLDDFNNPINLVSGSSTNSGVISFDSSLVSIASGANLTNLGTIGGISDVLTIASGSSLLNGGLISIFSDGSGLSNSGTFVNNSQLLLDVHTVLDNAAGAYIANTGTISADAAAMMNEGTFINTSMLALGTGNDPSRFVNSGTFNNSGTMNISFINFNNTFSNSGNLNNTGTINLVYDCCLFSSPISNSGIINNSNVLNISSTNFGEGGLASNSFSNSGTINNNGTAFNNSGSVISNTGLINNTGTFNNAGTFTNSGSVLISSTGLFTTSTNYTQTLGSTVVDGTLNATGGAIVDIQAGTLGGTGTINGDVLMAGTMMPGDAPGILTINGNYEQTGAGYFDDLMSPLSQSLLNVNGNVLLDPGAMLQITLLDGFDPLGQTFAIMDYNSLTGTFANGSSFWDDNFLWDITYGQNQVDVTAVQAPEPSSLLLLGVGSLALATFAKRKRVAQYLA